MGEVLTSDLVYGDDAEFGPSGVMTKGPSVAKRGEALPKGYKGPPSPDELRELGVLVDEDLLARSGGLEAQGGRPLPEALGSSASLSAMKARQARNLSEEIDENQEELREKSEAGEPLDMDEGQKEATGKQADAIKMQQSTRPELASAPSGTPEESELDKKAEQGKNQ